MKTNVLTNYQSDLIINEKATIVFILISHTLYTYLLMVGQKKKPKQEINNLVIVSVATMGV